MPSPALVARLSPTPTLALALTLAGCATASPAADQAPSAQASAQSESGAASSTAAAGAPAEVCADEAHHQFDFWIGAWEVKGPRGALAGHNRIESILGGCALHESWEGAGPSRGQSFSIFDASRGVWHQSWVDNGGHLLRIEGGLDAEGRMVLQGEMRGPKGEEQLHEIAWTPVASDHVRQHWRVSSDGGDTWKDLFIGEYHRVSD
ncbi:MAG: hypothetical protein KC468_36380, partial [Myxococcales bacterium]|nr:hypothetical protein [Myxococcales bacterium]